MRASGVAAGGAVRPSVDGSGPACHGIDLLFTFCSYAANRCRVGRMADNFLPLVAAIVVAGLAALAVLVVFSVRALRRRDPQAADPQLLELARLQAATAVRIQATRDMLAGRQPELHRAVNDPLDSVTRHLTPSI